MTGNQDFLQGYAQGLQLVSDAIAHHTHSQKGGSAMQDVLNGVILAIHDGQCRIKQELANAGEEDVIAVFIKKNEGGILQ